MRDRKKKIETERKREKEREIERYIERETEEKSGRDFKKKISPSEEIVFRGGLLCVSGVKNKNIKRTKQKTKKTKNRQKTRRLWGQVRWPLNHLT